MPSELGGLLFLGIALAVVLIIPLLPVILVAVAYAIPILLALLAFHMLVH